MSTMVNVAVCCCVLQCDAVWCSAFIVLQCVAVIYQCICVRWQCAHVDARSCSRIFVSVDAHSMWVYTALHTVQS